MNVRTPLLPLLALLSAIRALPALAYPAIAAPNLAPGLDPAAAAWHRAARAVLGWNVTHARPAREPARVRIASDGKALYLRFDVAQRQPIVATQHTDDVGQGSDDAVWVDLWPSGNNGYQYQFEATPNGTHYQSSSENTAYAPTWQSRGRVRPGGYTVTMRIPLDVMRGIVAGHPWKVQFVRYLHATGIQQVWSYDATQTNADDYARAGTLTLAAANVSVRRPLPRVAVYALGEAASRSIGGSTSRIGADVSLPIAPTASLFATFHPDYSNVELDQQSISPTVFARFYNEVRPFFTQAANFYDRYDCDACPTIVSLYTPAIPTPREGYALEGVEGPFSLAGFDAIGDRRSDLASAATYVSPDHHWTASLQRVAANLPTLVDDTTTAGVAWNDGTHLEAYLNYGDDTGTNVLTKDQGQYYDVGGGWGAPTFGIYGALRKVGAYYNPVDGFVSHPGIAGFAVYSTKIWDFAPNSLLASAGIAGFVDRYQGPSLGSAQSDNSLVFDVLTKSAIDLQLDSGSNYWRFGNDLTPISQNAGFTLTYHSGLQTNNPGNFPYHGSSATPTSISYATGRYGAGRLDTWFRSTTLRVGMRGALTLALDDTAQWLPSAPNVQWFESASYAYQLGAHSSLAVGLRRIVGTPPDPNGGGNCVGTCANVSVAYHLRVPHAEFYLAYGDPNTLSTVPQAIFKVIFYAGAEKGT